MKTRTGLSPTIRESFDSPPGKEGFHPRIRLSAVALHRELPLVEARFDSLSDMSSSEGSAFRSAAEGEPGAVAGFPAGSSARASSFEAASSDADTVLLPILGLPLPPRPPVFLAEVQTPLIDVSGYPIPASEASTTNVEALASAQPLGSHELNALEHDEFAKELREVLAGWSNYTPNGTSGNTGASTTAVPYY